MSQDPYAPQYQPQPGSTPYQMQYQPQGQNAAQPYAPQYPYQPQPGAAPYAPQYPYPPQSQQYPYPPQQAYPPQPVRVAGFNPRANRAMINGIISIILGFLTLVTLIGYAGIITGTFAIIYGFIGLNIAKRMPGNPGRGKAIAGIVLGCAALFLVLVSFLVRAGRG